MAMVMETKTETLMAKAMALSTAMAMVTVSAKAICRPFTPSLDNDNGCQSQSKFRGKQM